MKIALSGASGFIGGHVVNALVSLGHNVLYLNRRTLKNDQNEIAYFDLDYSDTLIANELLDVDVVIHLAACVHNRTANIDDHLRRNYEATKNLYEACVIAGVKKFIFASTVAVYGVHHSEHILDINSEVNPKTHYSMSKLKAERFLLDSKKTEMVVSVVRLPLVYGKKAPGNILLLSKLARSLMLMPFSGFENKRSFVDVGHLSEVFCQMCEKIELYPGLHLLCQNKTISTRQLTEKVLSDNNIFAINFSIPKWVLKVALTIIFKRTIYEQLCGNLVFESTIKLES